MWPCVEARVMIAFTNCLSFFSLFQLATDRIWEMEIGVLLVTSITVLFYLGHSFVPFEMDLGLLVGFAHGKGNTCVHNLFISHVTQVE